MIREIVLIDFMSHTHTVIEPAAGLTVLIGPNNCGKSSVVAALQIVAANTTKSHMIRHGCKECAVTIETSDGHTVTWRRRGKVVSYTIDGQDIHRLEGNVPDGLHEILKLAPVVSVEGGDAFDVHFARQKEPIFLLNGTGKQAAAFFASSSDAARLMEMQQRHRERVREHGHLEKLLQKQVASLRVQMESLSELPDLDVEVRARTREYQGLLDQNGQIGQMTDGLAMLAQHEGFVMAAQAKWEALAALLPPPRLQDTAPLEALIDRIGDTYVQAKVQGEQAEALGALCVPPQVIDVSILELLCDHMTTQRIVEEREAGCSNALSALHPPPSLCDAMRLDRLIGAISRESQVAVANAAASNVLRNLPEAPLLSPTSTLASMIAEWKDAERDLARRELERQAIALLCTPPLVVPNDVLAALIMQFRTVESLVTQYDAELDEVSHHLGDMREMIARWSSENPTCPTCGAAVHSDLLLTCAEARAHV